MSGNGLLDKCFEASDRLEDFVAEVVTALQVVRVVETEPHFALCACQARALRGRSIAERVEPQA